MRHFLILLGIAIQLPASAQLNWADAGMPGRSLGVRQLYVDPLENKLYAIGVITNGGTNITNKIVMRYDGTSWDNSLVVQGHPFTAIRFGDTLLIGGNNLIIDGLAVSCIGAYYDGQWHSFGEFDTGVCRKLRIIDGELYAVGAFNYVDGNYCNGIAKRENGQWTNVGFLENELPNSNANLTDIAKYQGDLYVCGGLNMMPNGENAVARFDGTTWTSPGGGVLGGVAAGRCLTVYNDELYMGGSIYLNSGNAGHMIMRWNGIEWYDVGGGFQDQWGTTDGAARCYALFEHEGKLLAGGGFFHAGGIPANKFAIWDGDRWCGTDDTMSSESESFAVYNDTLYMASGLVVNGDSVNQVIKWINGPIVPSACNDVAVAEINEISTILLWPNPATDHILLNAIDYGNGTFQITDALGRIVQQGKVPPSGELRIAIDGLQAGAYIFTLSTQEHRQYSHRFLKE